MNSSGIGSGCFFLVMKVLSLRPGHVARRYRQRRRGAFVNEKDHQIPAFDGLPIRNVQILASNTTAPGEPNVRLPEHDIFDFVGRYTVFVQNLLDKSIFPDHLMKVQADSSPEQATALGRVMSTESASGFGLLPLRALRAASGSWNGSHQSIQELS